MFRLSALKLDRAGFTHPRRIASTRIRLALTLLLSTAIVTGSVPTSTRPGSALEQTVELLPQAMTHTDATAPSTVYAGSTDTMVSHQHATYLKFDTSKIASKSTVVSAELQMSVTTSTASTPALWVAAAATRSPDSSIPYDKMTYESRPPLLSGVLNPSEGATALTGKTLTTHLTGLTKTKIESSLGLRITAAKSNVIVRLSKDKAPVLRLVIRVPQAVPRAPVQDTANRPTDLPYSTAAINSSTKKVFAHYFPPYPISIDNKPPSTDYYALNYLSPDGENGKFRSVGGLLRDRPEVRNPISGDAKLTDAVTEVKQAAAAGIDGFNVDILAWSGDMWDASLRIAKAAELSGTGFVAVPNIDMASDARNATVATMAKQLATYYAQPGAYRLPDGRFMLSIFLAEARPASYYGNIIAELRDKYGIDVAWSGIFNSLSDAQIEEYAPISYSLGTWGARSAQLIRSFPNRAAAVQRYGVKWVAPIAVQDVRHRTLSYAESENTELMRASWARAISDGADFAQLVTWNDYSESTGFAPSVAHRSAFLDLNGYYLTEFKTGSATKLTGDELIVTHRIQKATTQPRLQSARMDFTLSGSTTTPRDTVEVLCLCQSEAEVTLTVGNTQISYDAPAGVSLRTVPLATGTISAKAVRDDVTVATATSPFPVVSSIDYWDLQYYAVSSRENP